MIFIKVEGYFHTLMWDLSNFVSTHHKYIQSVTKHTMPMRVKLKSGDEILFMTTHCFNNQFRCTHRTGTYKDLVDLEEILDDKDRTHRCSRMGTRN